MAGVRAGCACARAQPAAKYTAGRGRAAATGRRTAGAALAGAAALLLGPGRPALARDVAAAEAAKEARRAALRAAAEASAESGRGMAAFQDSEYAVSEDKSPNVHTRQDEGLKQSRGY